MNGSITSCGKPCGYVGNACAVTTPISSQWPVVVSLPFERSSSRPATAGAPGCGGQPSSGSTLPSPSASSVRQVEAADGAARRCRACPSPRRRTRSASGSSPAPTASSTITQALGMRAILGRRWRTSSDCIGVRSSSSSRGRRSRRASPGSSSSSRRRSAQSVAPGELDSSGSSVAERRVVEAVRLGHGLVGELAVEHVDAAGERRVARDRRRRARGRRSPRRTAASRSSAPSSR